MKLNKYFFLLGLATMALTTACEDQSEEITDVAYDRLFAPINLEARVVNEVNVRVTWAPVEGATSYNIAIHVNNNQDVDLDEKNVAITQDGSAVKTISGLTAADSPYVVTGLEGETVYSAWVQAVGEGIPASKWSGILFETDAEQIFEAVNPDEIGAKEVTLRWPAGESADKIVLTPGDITYTITADDITAGAATITDLVPETEYTAVMYRGTKTRGTISFKTGIDLGGKTPVEAGEDLIAILDAAEEGESFVLFGDAYEIGNYTLTKSVALSSYKPTEKTTITGSFKIVSEVASLTLNDLIITGQDNLAELTDAAGNLGTLTVSGCEIRNTGKHIIYNNKKGTFGDIIIDNCIIDGVADDGGDGFDLRGGALTSLTVTNTTIMNGIRSLNRIQVVANVTYENCTFYNICTNDNSNNTGLFRVEKAGSTLTVKNCLVANVGVAAPANANAGTWGRADKLKAEEDFKNIYYFASPNLWTNSHKDDYATFAAEADPMFKDAANGDLTLGNEDLIYNKVGDPRWIP